MKFFTKMALKNLFRHKLRTSISIIAIAISIIVVVFTRGLINGMIDSLFANQIQFQSGHIRIVNSEYEQRERLLSLNYTIEGFEDETGSEMLAQLEEQEGIEMAIPRLKFGAVVSTENDLVEMMGWGVDPEKEKRFTDIEEMIIEGRMPETGDNEITMGSGLLDKLDKDVGDSVTILYNTAFNSFKGRTFNIVGEVESELRLLNDNVFHLPITEAQNILDLEDEYTEIILASTDLNQVDNILPGINEYISDKPGGEKYSITPWNEFGGLVYWMQMARKIYNVIYVFLVVLSSFVVINTMVMIVNERTREIGMMSALGLKSSGILKLFILEGTIMGIIGSFVGAIGGGIITRIIESIGINYTETLEGMGEEIMMNPVIYPSFSYEDMLFGFILGIIITAIACIIPARRAAKMEPNDALREVN
ncbi:MAG: ABC transporter permease [Bacillota bacterium]